MEFDNGTDWLSIDDDLLDTVDAEPFANQWESLNANLSGAFVEYIQVDSPEEMLWPWMNNPYFLPIVVSHAITFVVGLVGNAVVISAMSRSRGERSVTSMFLVSLAVADLLLVGVCAPLETMNYFLNRWTNFTVRTRLCQLQSYVEMLSAVASVLNMTAVSLERYIVIVHPMRSRSFCTMRNCRRALIAVWIIALILTFPVVITRDSFTYIYYNNETMVEVHYCMDVADDQSKGQGQYLASYRGLIFACYQLAIMLVIPLLLMIICYSRVMKELWLSNKQISAMTRDYSTPRTIIFQTLSLAATPPTNDVDSSLTTSATVTSELSVASSTSTAGANRMLRLSKRYKANSAVGAPATSAPEQGQGGQAKQARKQVIKMLCIVVLLFLVCWAPRLLLNVFIKWELVTYDVTLYRLRIALYLLPFVHSCLNPIIYSFMSSNFRRLLRRAFQASRCWRLLHRGAGQGVGGASSGHAPWFHGRHAQSTVLCDLSHVGGLQRHTSAYCPSLATIEAVLTTPSRGTAEPSLASDAM